MKSTYKKQSGKSKAQLVEWRVCDDEHDWHTAQRVAVEGLTLDEPSIRPTHAWPIRWGITSFLIVSITALCGAWWLWGIAQKGLSEIEAEIEEGVRAEFWSGPAKGHTAETTQKERNLLSGVRSARGIDEAVVELEIRDLNAGWAVVDVLLRPKSDGQFYRQTRVYESTERGWVRAEVTAERWGRESQFESEYFVFYFHAIDRKAVLEAAPQLDALYLSLTNNLLSDMPPAEKQAIIIDPEQTIELLTLLVAPPDPLIVASPSASLRPADLAVSDLLIQSAMLALFEVHATLATQRYESSSQMEEIYPGLRLWLMWQHELPLALWREPIVKWVFRDPQVAVGPNALATPNFAKELCTHHALWVQSPLSIAIPILCWKSEGEEEKIVAWRYDVLPIENPLTSVMGTRPLSNESSQWQDSATPDPVGPAVGVATVFEYVVSVYGIDYIPLLIRAMPQYDSTESLVPALFGISEDDFHHGWQTYMVESYGVSP
jgi:hypothetical protein